MAAGTETDAEEAFRLFDDTYEESTLSPTRDNLRRVGAAITQLRTIIGDESEILAKGAVEYLRVGIIFGRRPFDALQAQEFKKAGEMLKQKVDEKRQTWQRSSGTPARSIADMVHVQSTASLYSGPARDPAAEILVKFTVPEQGVSRLIRMKIGEAIGEFVARNLDRIAPHDEESHGLFLAARTEYDSGRWLNYSSKVGDYNIRDMDVVSYHCKPDPVVVRVRYPGGADPVKLSVSPGSTVGDLVERLRQAVWADYYDRNWALFVDDAYIESTREVTSIQGIETADNVEVRQMTRRMRGRVASLSAFAVITVEVPQRGITVTQKYPKNRTLAEFTMAIATKAQLDGFNLSDFGLRLDPPRMGMDDWMDLERTLETYVEEGLIDNVFNVVFERKPDGKDSLASKGRVKSTGAAPSNKQKAGSRMSAFVARIQRRQSTSVTLDDDGEEPEDFELLKENIEKFEIQQEEKMIGNLGGGTFEIKLEELEKNTTASGVLGAGTFGEVCKGTFRGLDVAIKTLKFHALSPKVLAEFANEVSIMRSLRHPNIVLFMGACAAPPSLLIVTELAPRGSLFDLLHKKETKWRPGTKQQITVLKDIACGVNYLHLMRPQIIHRDLKSLNVLVGDNYEMKLCDFGLSRIREKTDVSLTTRQGTPKWMAPEVMRNEHYDEKSDIYSLALLMFEVTTGELPFEDLNIMQLLMQVGLNGSRCEIPASVFPPLKDLIVLCWSQHPQDRPSAADVVTKLEALRGTA